MVIGPQLWVPPFLGGDRSWRQIALALWSFLLPAWFSLEEMWFAPIDKKQRESFAASQRKARATWVVAAGAVAILIGAAPSSPAARRADAAAAGVLGRFHEPPMYI